VHYRNPALRKLNDARIRVRCRVGEQAMVDERTALPPLVKVGGDVPAVTTVDAVQPGLFPH
jgi:hypothetical protein